MEEPELEVGSDEDGELEAYNLDPGKCLFHHLAYVLKSHSSVPLTSDFSP